jgi:quercetin dioxygenase-like cupin family protein
MRCTITVAAVAGAFAIGWVLYAATTQDQKVVFMDSAKLEYKAVAPGASMAVVMGDPEKGKHSAFVKFEPGAKFDMHSHSSNLRLVVLKGAYLYKGKNGEEHRVGPGMFITNPAGDHHWSGGDEKEGALFYMEGDDKFDLIPDKK